MAQKKLSCQIKQASGDRRLKFIASTSTSDRDNDEIMVSGWQLDNYLKNPVILLNHKYDSLPIARAVNIYKDIYNDKLQVIMEFPMEGVYELADTVYNLASASPPFINAVSVGFQGLEYERKPEGGRIYTKQELLEISIVGVPANPQALQTAMAKGLITEKQVKLFQDNYEFDLDAIEWPRPDSYDTRNLVIDEKGIRQTSTDGQRIVRFKADETWNIEGLQIKTSEINKLINESIDKALNSHREIHDSSIDYDQVKEKEIVIDLGGMKSVLRGREASEYMKYQEERKIKEQETLKRLGW